MNFHVILKSAVMQTACSACPRAMLNRGSYRQVCVCQHWKARAT